MFPSGMGELLGSENRKLDKQDWYWRENVLPCCYIICHSQKKQWRRRKNKHRDGGTPKAWGTGDFVRQVLCLGNVVVSLRLPYVVERLNKLHTFEQKIGQGFCPFLRWLCMEEGITPLVWSTVAKVGTVSGSFALAQHPLQNWGISISLKRVERLTYHFNKQGLSMRNSRLFQLKQGTLPITPVFRNQRVVISVDGGRTRIREAKKGKRRQNTNRHGYNAEWIEPKLVTIYVVDHQGKRVNTTEIPVINDGTYGKLQPFLELLEMHLVRLGINLASQVLLIADGAEWIWKHIPPLLQRLGCPPESTHELLDFYHATEHLQLFADAAFTQPKQRIIWFKTARSTLKRGQAVHLIEQMPTLSQNISGERRSIINSQIQYLTKFHQQGRLSYSQLAASKMPIGSGAIESLIRQVVNLRLKGNGKFWLRDNAEAILHARCQWAAGTWSTFCDSILTARLYPA